MGAGFQRQKRFHPDSYRSRAPSTTSATGQPRPDFYGSRTLLGLWLQKNESFALAPTRTKLLQLQEDFSARTPKGAGLSSDFNKGKTQAKKESKQCPKATEAWTPKFKP